ncbi:MAG: hypothetical protein WC461_03175 [Candidatus Paceibacterota bacterium]
MIAFIYIINRFFYRFVDFWRHWYIGSFKIASHIFLSVLEALDRKVAFKITLKNFFQPLYQDRSFIGYFLGFIFRTIRLFFGGIFYLFVFVLALAVYLFWLAIPILVIFEIIKGLSYKL